MISRGYLFWGSLFFSTDGENLSKENDAQQAIVSIILP